MAMGFGVAAFLIYNKGGQPKSRKVRLQQYLKKLMQNKRKYLSLIDIPFSRIVGLIVILVAQLVLYLVIKEHQMHNSLKNKHNQLLHSIFRACQAEHLLQLTHNNCQTQIIACIVLGLVQVCAAITLEVSWLRIDLQDGVATLWKFKVYEITKHIIRIDTIKEVLIIRKGKQKFSHNTMHYSITMKTTDDTQFNVYRSSVLPMIQRKYLEIQLILGKPIDIDSLATLNVTPKLPATNH